jgi:activator of 2-hydroxyglutaryl-CoA dehydratase
MTRMVTVNVEETNKEAAEILQTLEAAYHALHQLIELMHTTNDPKLQTAENLAMVFQSLTTMLEDYRHLSLALTGMGNFSFEVPDEEDLVKMEFMAHMAAAMMQADKKGKHDRAH